MTIRAFLIVAVASLVTAPALAAPLSEAQATAAAVRILMGDPYGKTPQVVMRHITESMLVGKGKTSCGPITKPVWSFHIVVPKADFPKSMPADADIDGYLQIDATSGKMVCAGLPYLD